eukprot:1544169-Amphidinium_carterae.1
MKNCVTVLIVPSPLPGSAPSKLFESIAILVTALIVRMPLSGSVPSKLFLYGEGAHCAHHLEPSPRERSLEAVFLYVEVRDFAHCSDAALGKGSFETFFLGSLTALRQHDGSRASSTAN